MRDEEETFIGFVFEVIFRCIRWMVIVTVDALTKLGDIIKSIARKRGIFMFILMLVGFSFHVACFIMLAGLLLSIHRR